MRYAPKLAGRALAESVGVPVPAMLWGPVSRLDDLTAPPHVAGFVAKPDRGHSGAGVVPVRRRDSRLYHARTGQRIRWQEVITSMRARLFPRTSVDRYDVEYEPGQKILGPFFCEALIDPPTDWKVYVVGGDAQFFLGSHRAGSGRYGESRFCTFDVSGIRIPPPRPAMKTVAMDPPRDPAAIVEAAERVARATVLDAVRIDLYETDAGPVFGELTPFPGGPYRFTPEWDARLLSALESGVAHA